MIDRIIWHSSRISPSFLFHWYSFRAKLAGLKTVYLILSFDCDTEKDIEVVTQVDAFLESKGIKAVYAVPGQLLEEGKDVYRRLADKGNEFINHGYYKHSIFQDGRYISQFYYDKIGEKNIIDDIDRGFHAVTDITGTAPLGFRAPHFGTFQKKSQLSFLHSTLKSKGYLYSSSTLPVKALCYGPVMNMEGFYEIPVSGCYDMPLMALDSWSFRFAPRRQVSEKDYVIQFKKMVDFFVNYNRPALLNYYADPSQVYDFDGFYEVVEYFISKCQNTIDYKGLLKLIS